MIIFQRDYFFSDTCSMKIVWKKYPYRVAFLALADEIGNK